MNDRNGFVGMLNEPIEQTIIIAENDSMVRGILRSILEQPGRALLLAADGHEAVHYAETVQATLVLLDMMMPRMGGIIACQQIRELSNYKDVPVVILTGFDSERARRDARRVGVTSFFVKPFTTDNLRRGLAPLIATGQEAITRAALPGLAGPRF
ncbi:MAG: response regulator [Acetobacteraceae bacterium]|nr:response regulator [Acetobacteraceae bacterium]